MCTTVVYRTKDDYFGRNLDLEYSYNETITITPRRFPFVFHNGRRVDSHYAIIGMAYVYEGYPLYYDGINEKGLAVAGLHFPGNAVYGVVSDVSEKKKEEIAPYELLPWILCQCENLEQTRELLEKTRLVHVDFRKNLPATPLHFMIADNTGSIVVEPVEEGLMVYENPIEVLTNNPPFPYQLLHLSQYMNMSNHQIEDKLSAHFQQLPEVQHEKYKLEKYSRGMGAMGLPGDLSSTSRFVKAAFTKLYSVSAQGEHESVNQTFHILGAVEQQRGCVEMENGSYEITRYSACCNMDKGIYYYKTYENSRIVGVDMHKENLEKETLITYPLQEEEQFQMQN